MSACLISPAVQTAAHAGTCPNNVTLIPSKYSCSRCIWYQTCNGARHFILITSIPYDFKQVSLSCIARSLLHKLAQLPTILEPFLLIIIISSLDNCCPCAAAVAADISICTSDSALNTACSRTHSTWVLRTDWKVSLQMSAGLTAKQTQHSQHQTHLLEDPQACACSSSQLHRHLQYGTATGTTFSTRATPPPLPHSAIKV